MFERPQGGERTLLVHIFFSDEAHREELEELQLLADSAGAEVLGVITGQRDQPDSGHFVGAGKLEEIRERVSADEVQLVLFNHALSPSQERNLERVLQCRVLDRTGLILDIFAQRARSFEGKLQVELAQLRHLSTRLIRGWTHLERQKGGIGLRGPGETQLESDRRMIGQRIKQIGRRLERVDRQRQQGRGARTRSETPTVALVGYTNAGKSTLFNRLTGAEVYSADQLFATLDPTLRRLPLDAGDHVVLADTVGFIRHLPHELVAAFRSTLLEAREADLLLHVADAADPDRDEHRREVDTVLAEIEADTIPQLSVMNKVDLIGLAPKIDRDGDGLPIRCWLSAKQGEGMELLRQAVRERLFPPRMRYALRLPATAGGVRSELFANGSVVSESVDDEGNWLMEVSLSPKRLRQLRLSPEFILFNRPETDRSEPLHGVIRDSEANITAE